MVDKLSPLASNRYLNQASESQKKSFDRLSSGKRINSAADDAAGLAIAEALASGAVVLEQGRENIDYGRAVASIQDSTLEQASEIGTKMQELSAQAANGTLSDSQRAALNDQYQAYAQELQRQSGAAEFNGQKVMNGEQVSIQVGGDSSADSQIATAGNSLPGIPVGDISTQAGALAALDSTKSFNEAVSANRGAIGATVARLDVAARNNEVSAENMRAAESRIRDADVADEAANLTRNKILTQTGTAMMAQANQSTQNVLRLLQ